MATRRATLHLEEKCSSPCLRVGAELVIFLKDGVLSVGGRPYVLGAVSAAIDTATGGAAISIVYQDNDLPEPMKGDGGVRFPTASNQGNVCVPDCAGDCDQISKIIRLIEAQASPAVITRSSSIFLDEEFIENASFSLSRIPYDPGYRLTSVKVTCFRYDPGTTLTLQLRVGSELYAEYTGRLGSISNFLIIKNVIPLDSLPTLTVSSISSDLYLETARGMTLELMGVIATDPRGRDYATLAATLRAALATGSGND